MYVWVSALSHYTVNILGMHTHTADLEQAEDNYEKAKQELETTLAELGDL